MTTAPHAHTHQASKCSRRPNETPRYDSKWPHAHARPASKCSPHHNGTPRYDRKCPPRHTETSIVTWCSRKKKIYIYSLNREHHVTIEHRATTRAQFSAITCSKCCACHEKNNITCSNAAPATKKKHNVLKVLHLPRKKNHNAVKVLHLPRKRNSHCPEDVMSEDVMSYGEWGAHNDRIRERNAR